MVAISAARVTAQSAGLRKPPHGLRKPVNVTHPFLSAHSSLFAPGRTLLSDVTDVADPSDENFARVGRTDD